MTRAITVRRDEADHAALDRLVRRSQNRAVADAVALVADARVGLEPNR